MSTSIDWEAECRAAWKRVEDLEGRKPLHNFSPVDGGHNCILCDEDSIWKCDPAAHQEVMPRWENDRLVREQGWNTPDRCANCGERNDSLVAERDRLRACLSWITGACVDELPHGEISAAVDRCLLPQIETEGES